MNNLGKKVFSLIKKVPIIGDLLLAANGYVLLGDKSFSKSPAPIQKWKFIFKDVFFALICGAFAATGFCYFGVSDVNASGLIQDFTPGFLGISVGIYALVFVVPTLVSKESFLKLKSTMKSISFNMSYPISALIFILLISVFTEHFPANKYTNFINFSLLIYSFVLVMEVVTYVTYVGRAIVTRRIKELEENSD
ncbi:MAG: hypothetical protein CMF17_09080 [Idiomarinaceae bacterium]|nr:hypothetical protein [Idiomarinaceae bacterium]